VTRLLQTDTVRDYVVVQRRKHKFVELSIDDELKKSLCDATIETRLAFALTWIRLCACVWAYLILADNSTALREARKSMA